ncbi:hypothetical protein [Photobacterium leiognathi]|uniref:hypothetical protein n=1 Tax=Photobacterium leiognathi TaxID=553611 RepID=UPI002980B29A|nr:hypothetical protein [Photobacterium leiognathi]
MTQIAKSRKKIQMIREDIKTSVKKGDVKNVSILLEVLESELTIFETLYSAP